MCWTESFPRREWCPDLVGTLCHQVPYFCDLCKGSTVMRRLTTGYVLRNASFGDFDFLRTSWSVLNTNLDSIA